MGCCPAELAFVRGLFCETFSGLLKGVVHNSIGISKSNCPPVSKIGNNPWASHSKRLLSMSLRLQASRLKTPRLTAL